MNHFSRRTPIAAPIAAVADFHFAPEAFALLNPPGMIIRFQRQDPMAEGAVAEFTIWLGPVPIHWRAVHTEVDREKGFTDTQERGPFAYWKHRHDFLYIDEQNSMLVDTVESEYADDLFGAFVGRLMWWGLPLLFAFRAWRTKRRVEHG